MILSFRTDKPGQTGQTQIRLLSGSTLFAILSASFVLITLMVEPHSSNFRVITTNFLGVRICRKITVIYLCRPHTCDTSLIFRELPEMSRKISSKIYHFLPKF